MSSTHRLTGLSKMLGATECCSLIASLLAKHLECPVEKIDTAQPFYSFGLSSLGALVLLGELENRTGLEIGPEILSNDATIDELAELFTHRIGTEAESMVPSLAVG